MPKRFSEYEIQRQGVWVIQVRKKGSQEPWSTTGLTYYLNKNEAIASVTPNPWPEFFEYRAVHYMPLFKEEKDGK